MVEINIGTAYTVIITVMVVIAISWLSIVTLEKSRKGFLKIFAVINETFVMVSGIYFVMFTYDAIKDYEKFLAEKGSYDKYTIALCIYYGAVQIGILFIYKILRLAGSSKRMIKK